MKFKKKVQSSAHQFARGDMYGQDEGNKQQLQLEPSEVRDGANMLALLAAFVDDT